MIALAFLLWQSLLDLREVVRDPRVRPLAMWLMILIVVGATFYHHIEGWSWLDAFYFCVIALSTVGFGDLAPATALGKIFTIFYVMSGIGILVVFVNASVERSTERRVRLHRRVEEPVAAGGDRGGEGDHDGM